MGLFSGRKNNKVTKGTAGSQGFAVPVHIAIIPDGNRRWAKKRMLPVAAGHREGAEVFRRIVRHAEHLGVKYITFYAFSTENWKRDDAEVETLMKLLLNFLLNSEKELGADKDKICIKVIGDRSRLSQQMQDEIARVEKETEQNTNIIVNMAINYGGRDELKYCIQSIACQVQKGALRPEDITEETITRNLYTKDTPDPDLLIRTSGEERISNYLLWQMAYTEFYFTKKLWPDFNEKDLEDAVQVYSSRQRRFGGK